MTRFGVRWLLVPLIITLIGAAAWFGKDFWQATTGDKTPAATAESGHDHDHAEASDSIAVTEQARQNLGLTTLPITLIDYWSMVSVPASVVEQPGHTHRNIAAPFTGLVTQVFIHPNQLVRPGDRIAELELSGDALAATQTELLQVLRELEVNQQETNRVKKLVAEAAVPERNLLQLEYERRRLDTQRESKIQQLAVLGLSSQQLDEIVSTKRLMRSFVISAPALAPEIKQHLPQIASIQQTSGTLQPLASVSETDWSYTVDSIDLFPGKRVQIGDNLCNLAFHFALFIEGQAFEKEGDLISGALVNAWPVTARFETSTSEPSARKNLHILQIDNTIDPVARTFRFYVSLPNEILLDSAGPLGETYRTWRFKPGQKAQLDVPVKMLPNVVVLPADAVVRDGLDHFVFCANGGRFDKRLVRVISKSNGQVVIANDGGLFPGEMVAANNAYQLNLAIKKAAGQGGGGHGHDHDHGGHSHSH